MKSFELIIASPDGRVFSGNAVKLSLRAAMGDLAVMAGHTPLITQVIQCECITELPDGTKNSFHIKGGLLSVANNRVTLLPEK